MSESGGPGIAATVIACGEAVGALLAAIDDAIDYHAKPFTDYMPKNPPTSDPADRSGAPT